LLWASFCMSVGVKERDHPRCKSVFIVVDLRKFRYIQTSLFAMAVLLGHEGTVGNGRTVYHSQRLQSCSVDRTVLSI
jgi:hypothetical protein